MYDTVCKPFVLLCAEVGLRRGVQIGARVSDRRPGSATIFFFNQVVAETRFVASPFIAFVHVASYKRSLLHCIRICMKHRMVPVLCISLGTLVVPFEESGVRG